MKCKDCTELRTIVFKPTSARLVTDSSGDSRPWPFPVRASYCPHVNIIVDLSAERECGCFIKKDG